ncbi:uncharacterized protein BP01DRAFT_321001 [Aspergillus saccharolyticus JOP 1030-1]|uniref:YMC020W-like alpha/beta hydrolase domain-containing protein n=1 Tax=Aspergillus saccharolyticus JOP 1030-1 TaxID=1450539 RepID=A0A318ZLC5_9EURO|nr:hypothetical protein BP01DRAFT_321001 [Aspergillus saccharolyticus JOP 1030-1]PYH44600.1 hypothetical protein BP01DRAFT_321001 [Aspergillus saccharolyticus JOP 1030-1]
MPSMGSRKRVKPSLPGADARSTTSSNDTAVSGSTAKQRAGAQKRGSGVSWYPTVWPAVSRASKAAPVTEVARESISAAQNTPPFHSPPRLTSSSTSQLSVSRQSRHPSLQLTRKDTASSRSLPASATTTIVNIASDGTASTPADDARSDRTTVAASQPVPEVAPSSRGPVGAGETRAGQSNTAPATADADDSATGGSSGAPSDSQPAGWFSWFYGPSTADNSVQRDQMAKKEEDPPAKPQDHKEEDRTVEGQNGMVAQSETDQERSTEVSEVSRTAQKRSWLQMLYGSSTAKGLENTPIEPSSGTDTSTSSIAPAAPAEPAAPAPSQEDNVQGEASGPVKPLDPNTKASGWSFWFRDASKDAELGKSQEVQVAEASMTQESLKKPAAEPESENQPRVEVVKKGSVKSKASKSTTNLLDKATARAEAEVNGPTPGPSETAAAKHLQKILPNQVLPRFEDTFALEEKPGILQTIGRYLHYNKQPENKHVYMVRDPPHIKKALAIGVHGYFPAPLIRSVLGQPTGTSIRFSTMAAEAIQKWAGDFGFKCEVEKIALEGEGRIAERVELLWKLLLNWMEEIRKADFILIACHSQGVPVAIMLVAKLISFGCINASRIGICAMAGVNLGPFTDYRSRWISGSAGELFEFALPYSQVSRDYEAALRACLDFGVRISYIGSIDDQLVSLESSLFTPVSHPYIYRAAFVDGRVHAPSFLSHLVGFVLKLRNLGIADHGLIRELSSPLAGSLYTGEGHSRLYDDPAVYRLAIQFALQTTALPSTTPSSTPNSTLLHIKRPQPPSTPANPYILPFAMRGILEEEYVRRELGDETLELLRQFDDWKPTSKVLKDVKFRLEGIRSKL